MVWVLALTTEAAAVCGAWSVDLLGTRTWAVEVHDNLAFPEDGWPSEPPLVALGNNQISAYEVYGRGSKVRAAPRPSVVMDPATLELRKMGFPRRDGAIDLANGTAWLALDRLTVTTDCSATDALLAVAGSVVARSKAARDRELFPPTGRLAE